MLCSQIRSVQVYIVFSVISSPSWLWTSSSNQFNIIFTAVGMPSLRDVERSPHNDILPRASITHSSNLIARDDGSGGSSPIQGVESESDPGSSLSDSNSGNSSQEDSCLLQGLFNNGNYTVR